MRYMLLLAISCIFLFGTGCMEKQDDAYVMPDINWERYSESDISSFQSKLKQVSTGDTYEKVILILGHPTCVDDLARKESPEIIARSASYYFKKDNPNLSNIKKDIYIGLYFCYDNGWWKLQEIYRCNITEQ